MRHPRSVKPESSANVENEIQIVDTHKSLRTLVGIGFAAGWLQLNRTLVIVNVDDAPVVVLARVSNVPADWVTD